jgi:hypothetical protein
MYQQGMFQWVSMLQELSNSCRRDKVCKNYLLYQERMSQGGMNLQLVILLLARHRVVLGGKGCLNLGH